MVKNVFKVLGIFILGISGGIFGSQILLPYFMERSLFSQYRLDQRPIYITEKKEIIIQENVALKNAIEKVKKVVVGVKTKTKAGKVLEGSGLILTSDGFIITLADLVPRGSEFSFFFEGELVSFQILKKDLKENLALVKIEKRNLPTVSFANLEKLKLGERVFLVGAVFDEQKKDSLTLVVNEGTVRTFDKNFIKTNISETHLLKGSPLFNIEGEVLGINTIDKEGKISTIPISKIKTFAGL